MESLVAAKALITGSVFALLFAAERIRAAAPRPAGRSRLFKNAALWLLILAVSPLIVAPLTALGANQWLWARGDGLMTGAAFVMLIVIDLLILDCWTYWLHRAYHRVPVMWRLHEVHHRDEFLDTTSAVRFHVGEVVLSALLRLIPIAVFAIPLSTVILFEILLLSSALFHHSNVRLPERFERALSRVIVTPSIHWVHHHAVREDTDANYASILSLWDPLFASRSRTKRTPEMKIGAEGLEELSFPGLLLSPFRGSGR